MNLSESERQIRGPRTAEKDINFRARQGALILRVAGDIKRDPEFLAQETGVGIDKVQAVLSGVASPQEFELLIGRMVEIYPFSRLNLEVVKDDTDEGAVIQTSENAKKTSRVFNRLDRFGNLSSYYEYRDAAMSAVGPFKPEWIKELRVPLTNDPDDPDVAYNKGHFQHQQTLYVGPVNLYWQDDNGSHISYMNTGDSNYGTPYVPHSFTSRDPDREAYIMAVTFAGRLETAVQQDLSLLPPDSIKSSLLDLSSTQNAFSRLFRRKLQDALLPIERVIKAYPTHRHRIEGFYDGSVTPTYEEIESLADILQINVRDLIPPNATSEYEVVVKRYDNSQQWFYPTEDDPVYRVFSLAGSPKISEVKSFKISPLKSSDHIDSQEKFLDLETPMHIFGYNYGQNPAVFFWEGDQGDVKSANIDPGGSFYLKPLKRHGLRLISGPTDFMIVRIGGNLSGDTFFELSSFPKESIERLLHETGLWY